MRADLTLRSRVLLAVLIAPVLAGGVIWATTELVRDRLLQPPWSLPPGELARCEADPAAWHPQVVDMVEAWAYDNDGHGAHPDAPPLEPNLRAGVETRGFAFAEDDQARGDARRVAPDGPCAIVRLRFGKPLDFAPVFRVGLVGGGTLAFLLLAGLAVAFVVQPLLRRIARLERAARGVGAPGYRPAPDQVPDALGEIATVLDRSHGRILAHQAQLEERRQALERHLADTAHDLRTPLASLLLAVQELGAAVPPGDPALRRALGDAEYVNALVDNLHQASRLRSGLPPATGSFDLGEIVSRLGTRFAALGALQEVEVGAATPDGPVVVRGAAALAERAVANLVHNAVRHGNEGGHVALVLDAADGAFCLTVLDDGPGLPPDAVDLSAPTFLTDPARGRSRGLGLAITQAAATHLGWTLRLESSPGAGLRAELRGPLVGDGAG